MRYDLVFEGGGAKGMAFVGACDAFFARGNEFDRLLGTSAGAITAALLAVGYGPRELLDALAEKENGKSVFGGFLGDPPRLTDDEVARSELRRILAEIDVPLVPEALERRIDDFVAKGIAASPPMRHVTALVERGGWFGADKFLAWLRKRLDSGAFRGEPRAFSGATLAQLFERTGVDLSAVAADTTDGRLLVLNHHTAPACPVVWAVRMSMSIPLVWNEVLWDAGWGPYLGRDLAGHAIVDGGLLSNFPIELFISDAPEVVELMGPKRQTEVLGLLIDESLAVPGAAPPRPHGPLDPTQLKMVQRLGRLVDTATTAHDKLVMDEHEQLVARVPAAGYGVMEFDMSDARRDTLVAGGRAAMTAYLDAHAARPRTRAAPAAAEPGRVRANRVARRILER